VKEITTKGKTRALRATREGERTLSASSTSRFSKLLKALNFLGAINRGKMASAQPERDDDGRISRIRPSIKSRFDGQFAPRISYF